MYASSQYPVPAAKGLVDVLPGALEDGQGRRCEACRRASAGLLLPQGRIGGWLLLLTGCCVYVMVQALALGLG